MFKSGNPCLNSKTVIKNVTNKLHLHSKTIFNVISEICSLSAALKTEVYRILSAMYIPVYALNTD